MKRKPRGFTSLKVPEGILLLREGQAHWVILAADPPIKVDNAHDYRIPHLHVGGWESEDRRDLRATLGPHEAARAIRAHLEDHGYIDVETLLEELR